MEFVNSIGGSLVGHRNAHQSTSNVHLDVSGSQSDSGLSRTSGNGMAGMHSASDVSNGLMDVFKATLGEADSYLGVFEARLKLEEDYVRGLKSLTDKHRDSIARLDAKIAASTSFDSGRYELPKMRMAWKEVQDNHLREIDARMHYIESVRQAVIAPLTVYRDAQERIRKRVKDDLKISISAYDEMRNHTLPRAKKAYEKRSEEVEQLRLQQVAIEDQKLLLSQAGMYKEGGQPAPTASTVDDRSFSPGSPNVHLDAEEENRTEVESTSGGAALLRIPSSNSQSNLSAKQNQRFGGSDGSEGASTSASPRLAAEQALSTSPPLGGEKKGHFLDALRSRETWETARKEGPKKLNALLNRMREGTGLNERSDAQSSLSISPDSMGAGSPPGSLGVSLTRGPGSMKSNQNLALKHVKAKREAEEADKAYRKAVFDLETMRMRRKKTLAAAKASAIEARRELYLTCQAVLLQAEQSAQSKANAQLSLSMHAEDVLRDALSNLDEEVKRLESSIPVLEDEPVPYTNFYFGESKSLLFGVSLVDYAFSRAQRAPPHIGPPKAEAPIIVQKCIQFIEERALQQPGIYRTSAKHTAVQNLAHAIERDEERFVFHPTEDEPSTVAGVLKLYLRQLPEPVLPIAWEDRVRYTHERQEQIQTGFASLKGRIRRLPAINQATLRLLVEHLAKVASFSEQNKMNASNLSIIFGPLLLSQLDHDATSIAAAMEEDRVTEDMILYADTIFNLEKAGAPILPVMATSRSSANAEEEWDLTDAEKRRESTATISQEQAVQPKQSVETVIPAAPTTESDYKSAADAYATPASPPPFVQSGVPVDAPAAQQSTEPSDPVSSPGAATANHTRLPSLDVQTLTLDEGARNRLAEEEDGDIAPTPTGAAEATPLTAVSSANASVGHDESSPQLDRP